MTSTCLYKDHKAEVPIIRMVCISHNHFGALHASDYTFGYVVEDVYANEHAVAIDFCAFFTSISIYLSRCALNPMFICTD